MTSINTITGIARQAAVALEQSFDEHAIRALSRQAELALIQRGSSSEELDRLRDFAAGIAAGAGARATALAEAREAGNTEAPRASRIVEAVDRGRDRLAQELAAQDLQVITDALVDARPDQLLVDGSAYSPSWRALPGGARAYAQDVGEAYEDELDRLTEGLEVAVHWEDGCLWRSSTLDPEAPAS